MGRSSFPQPSRPQRGCLDYSEPKSGSAPHEGAALRVLVIAPRFEALQDVFDPRAEGGSDDRVLRVAAPARAHGRARLAGVQAQVIAVAVVQEGDPAPLPGRVAAGVQLLFGLGDL